MGGVQSEREAVDRGLHRVTPPPCPTSPALSGPGPWPSPLGPRLRITAPHLPPRLVAAARPLAAALGKRANAGGPVRCFF